MKSVLIVGGGPAGLVAAKTLLHRAGTPFRVTVFEKAERVGGIWRPRKDEEGDKCSPEMRTNLSRFTVSFSDLSWQSVQLDATTGGPERPMFPKAYEVGQYLEEYAERFIPREAIFCNREVQTADIIQSPHRRWTVSSLDTASNTTHNDEFDYLVVASGFFDRPAQSLADKNSEMTGLSVKPIHSSRVRSLSALTEKPGNIVVIGGGISGCEAAATAAFQVSNAKYNPTSPKPGYAESKVHHVHDRPFYCLPRYLPQDPYSPAKQDYNLSPTFVPIDLALYNLSRRGEGPISAVIGPVPTDRAEKGHEFIRYLLGGDQRDLGRPELVYRAQQTEFPAFTGISETYAEFVRSGLIVPVQGRGHLSTSADGRTLVDVTQTGVWTRNFPSNFSGTDHIIDDVTAIIEATGFQVHLDYLSDTIKQALDYDPTCHRVPFLLSRGSIHNPAIPELAFAGFYEGPFWSVMENQARLIAQLWDPLSNSPNPTLYSNLADSRAVRNTLQSSPLSTPQFWMHDYVGLVEEFSRLAGISRNDTNFSAQSGPVIPARYADPSIASPDPESTITELHSVLVASTSSARFVSAAAFTAMQGEWLLSRKIDSRHASSPGGTLTGTASFHPRAPTAPGYTAEYLYVEHGTFTMDTGLTFPATRRYVYRYSEKTDTISTFFVDEDGLSAERLFNELVFERERTEGKGWVARSSHWCEPDQYDCWVECRFRGVGMREMGIGFEVRGPKKDYGMESWYRRKNVPP